MERLDRLSVHLVNPSDNSFGTAVITPRWLFVLAAATPRVAGDPILVDESLEQIAPETIQPGDIVGISVHTGNALRGYEVGRMARSRGAWVVYGGIHATLFPEEALERGEGHAVVTGDGDVAWGKVVVDCMAGKPEKIYEGGRIGGSEFLAARWDLMDPEKYMWASVQTIRGCPKHCSFCSVWRTDGQKPRQRRFQSVVDEIVALRRLGFRFIALADDNFYPVTFTDLRLAKEQNNLARLEELTAIRAERFHLMEELAKLPKDMVFYTQMTMEAGEDVVFLDAMKKANIKGALVEMCIRDRPIVDAAQLLGFLNVEEGDAAITESGTEFANSEILRQKELFRDAALANVLLLRQIRRALETKSDHSVPDEFFIDMLNEQFSEEECERQIETAVTWGRYAELFDYDAGHRRFVLPDAQDEEIAASEEAE